MGKADDSVEKEEKDLETIVSYFFMLKNVGKRYLKRISDSDRLKVNSEKQLLESLMECDAKELAKSVRAEHMNEKEIASVPAKWREELLTANPARCRRDPISYETGYMPDHQTIQHDNTCAHISNKKIKLGSIEVRVSLSKSRPITFLCGGVIGERDCCAEHWIVTVPNETLKIWLN